MMDVLRISVGRIGRVPCLLFKQLIGITSLVVKTTLSRGKKHSRGHTIWYAQSTCVRRRSGDSLHVIHVSTAHLPGLVAQLVGDDR